MVVQDMKKGGRQKALTALLIPLGKDKTTTTIFELGLKQVLSNTSQEDGQILVRSIPGIPIKWL